MKRTIFLAALLLVATLSCRKNPNTPANKGIVGKWRFVLMTGGIGNIHMTAAQWGHTKSYDFGEKNKCTFKLDNTVTNTTYATSTDTSYTSRALATFVTLGNTGAKYEYMVRHDSLMLQDDVRVDGMTEWYVREY